VKRGVGKGKEQRKILKKGSKEGGEKRNSAGGRNPSLQGSRSATIVIRGGAQRVAVRVKYRPIHTWIYGSYGKGEGPKVAVEKFNGACNRD